MYPMLPSRSRRRNSSPPPLSSSSSEEEDDDIDDHREGEAHMAYHQNYNPSVGSGSRKRIKLTLGHRLYDTAKDPSSTLTDLIIYLGERKGESAASRPSVGGHVAVFSVMSEVFATQLSSPCWNADTLEKEKKVVQLPEDVSEASARAFVKYLYTEELDVKGDGGDDPAECDAFILDLMALADMYLVQGLLGTCNDLLFDRITIENCVNIYEKTKRYSAVSRVGETAYGHLTSRINAVISEMMIDNFGKRRLKDFYRDWEPETWKALLQEEYLIVDEINLFRALLLWKNSNESSREDSFTELVQLLRYPLMSPEDFSKYVVPSKLLSSDDAVQIYMLMHNEPPVVDSPSNTQEPRFNCQIRRQRKALNSESLDQLLKHIRPYDVINLQEDTTYKGNFVLATSNVTIRGPCPERKAILRPNLTDFPILTIGANFCSLKNMSFLSPSISSSLQKARREHSFVSALRVIGTKNSFENLTFGIESRQFPSSTIIVGTMTDVVLNVVSDSPIPSPILPSSPDVHYVADSGDSEGVDEIARKAIIGDNRSEFDYGLQIVGNENHMGSILVTQYHKGISIDGNCNILTEAEVRDCDIGLSAEQNKNILNSIVLKNIKKTGIVLDGEACFVKTVQFVSSYDPRDFRIQLNGDGWVENSHGISILGNSHVVTDIICEGFQGRTDWWSVYMVGTRNCTVKNIGGGIVGRVTVRGVNNRLENVKKATNFNVFGDGHMFVGCQADELLFPDEVGNAADAEFIDCRFLNHLDGMP